MLHRLIKNNKFASSSYSIKNEYKYNTIDDIAIRNYIDNRLLGQIEWYDKKSAIYQKKYKKWTIASAVLSAIIPILTLALEYSVVFKFAIAIISSIVSVISSILTLNKYKELWVQYRTNCEILKSVLHRYYTRTGEFNSSEDHENFKSLVTSCENYLTKEFSTWSSTYRNQSHSSKGS